MIIFLGHLQVAYNCIDVMHFSRHNLSLIQCFDKFNFSCLKTYMITTYVLLKPIRSCTIVSNFVLFLINVQHCFRVYVFIIIIIIIIVILDHLKPYACH